MWPVITVAHPWKIRTCCLSLHNLVLLFASEGGTWAEGMGTVLCKTQYILSVLYVAVTHKKTWLMSTDTLVYFCQKQTLTVGRKEAGLSLPQRNAPSFCPGTIPQIQMTNSFSSKSPLLCSLTLGAAHFICNLASSFFISDQCRTGKVEWLQGRNPFTRGQHSKGVCQWKKNLYLGC